jgi:hypothetical protein
MTATLDVGERLGALEVVALVSAPDEPERYRLRCLRCKSETTPHQRVVAAFKRKLDLSPEREEIDRAA